MTLDAGGEWRRIAQVVDAVTRTAGVAPGSLEVRW